MHDRQRLPAARRLTPVGTPMFIRSGSMGSPNAPLGTAQHCRLGLAAAVALATLFLPSAAAAQRRILTRTLPPTWNDAIAAGKVRVVDPGKASAVVNDRAVIQLRPGQVAVAQVAKATRTELRTRPGTASTVDTVRILPYAYLTLGASGDELRLRHTYVTESALQYDRNADDFKGGDLKGVAFGRAKRYRLKGIEPVSACLVTQA